MMVSWTKFDLRRTIRRTAPKILLGAAVMTALSACRDADVDLDADMKVEAIDDDRDRDDATAIQVIQTIRSRQRPFRFGGRRYAATLFRRGDRFFLRGRIEEGNITPPASAVKELGKNIRLSPRGLVFENGRMTVEYRDSAGKRRKAGVPFGDVYGGTHVSEMPPFIPDRYPESEEYYSSGALVKDEGAIKSCLPNLKELLLRDDAKTLADMMAYPLLADVDSVLTVVKDRKEFVALYPRIFTPARKRAILKLNNTEVHALDGELAVYPDLWLCIANDDRLYFYCLFLSCHKVLQQRLANQRRERK